MSTHLYCCNSAVRLMYLKRVRSMFLCYTLFSNLPNSVIVQLLSLDLWEPSCDPKTEISEKVMKKLQDDIAVWIGKELDHLADNSNEIKDKVIPEMEKLISKLRPFSDDFVVSDMNML